MPAEALQSSNIRCAHESCLVIQLKLIKTICQINSESEKIHSKSDVLISIRQMVLIGFNSVRRISSHWKKIFSAVWEEDNGGILNFIGKLRLCIPDQALC